MDAVISLHKIQCSARYAKAHKERDALLEEAVAFATGTKSLDIIEYWKKCCSASYLCGVYANFWRVYSEGGVK